jgi:xylonate dehydratase
MVLACRGPMGAGMEETYQVTSALKYLPPTASTWRS